MAVLLVVKNEILKIWRQFYSFSGCIWVHFCLKILFCNQYGKSNLWVTQTNSSIPHCRAMTQSESNHLELPAAWKVILVTQMDYVSRCTSHWSQKEGSTLLKSRADTTNQTGYRSSTKLTEHDSAQCHATYSMPQTAKQIASKASLTPLQGQPTIINKLWWALRHVIHWNVFTTQHFSHRLGKNPASFSTKWWSWYSLIWRTWGMDSGKNYSSFHLSLAMLYIFTSQNFIFVYYFFKFYFLLLFLWRWVLWVVMAVRFYKA